MDAAKRFGQGFAFPPRVGEDGRMRWSNGPENIRESIRIILLTEPAERIMLPEFGGGLGQFLFRPNVAATHHAIEDAIVRSLKRWEPRIRVGAVTVQAVPDDASAAMVTIRYTLIASRTQEQMRLRLNLGGGA